VKVACFHRRGADSNFELTLPGNDCTYNLVEKNAIA
jgi:hypothetical protein